MTLSLNSQAWRVHNKLYSEKKFKLLPAFSILAKNANFYLFLRWFLLIYPILFGVFQLIICYSKLGVSIDVPWFYSFYIDSFSDHACLHSLRRLGLLNLGYRLSGVLYALIFIVVFCYTGWAICKKKLSMEIIKQFTYRMMLNRYYAVLLEANLFRLSVPFRTIAQQKNTIRKLLKHQSWIIGLIFSDMFLLFINDYLYCSTLPIVSVIYSLVVNVALAYLALMGVFWGSYLGQKKNK